MRVFTYLELHTVLIGWTLYDLLWAAFASTGIILLPILWIIVSNWKEAATRNRAGEKSDHTDGKAMAMDLFIASLVIFFVATPIYPIQPSKITYTAPPSFSQPDTTTYTTSSDPSTFKTNLGPVLSSVTPLVPAWWAVVMSVSAGVTNAVISGLPTPGDLREAKVALSSNNVENPKLAHEYRSFVSNCYIPAKNKLEDQFVDGRVDPTGIKANDIDWPGGKYLMTMPGGYAVCPGANVDICGHTIRPVGVRGLGKTATCADWWRLLKADIYAEDSDNDTIWSNLKGAVTLLSTFSTEEVVDARVKSLLNNMNTSTITNEYNYGNPGGLGATMWGVIEDVTGAIAIGSEAISRSSLINVMKQAVPIIIAISTMVLYFMMPAALIFTAYRLEAVIALTFVVFSLIFTHALLAVASWLDYNLIVSLFDDFSLMSWLSSDSHFLGTAQKRWLINIITGALYAGMPLIWLYVMAIAGVGAGRATGTMVGASMGSAGKLGADTSGKSMQRGASGIAKKAGSAVASKFKR